MNVQITAGKRKRISVASTSGNVVVRLAASNHLQLTKYRDGLSAYELAVINGYQGTEAEFVSGMIEEDIDFLAHYILSKN